MDLTRRRFLEFSSGAVLTSLTGNALAQTNEPRPNKSRHAPPSPVDAARGVLERQLGPDVARFDLHEIAPDGSGHHVFEVSASQGRVRVEGSSGVALCRGAYTYLRQTGCGMITWSGARLDLPKQLPDLAKQRVVCPYRYVQYFNPCTFGYTMPFWDWERWQRELDWMALHGITMPLALDGQEAIWQRVWSAMGLSGEEISLFSVGPAHQPWHWMGNINNVTGPNLQSFVDSKRVLQRKILDRMRELGMQPVVPGFSGFVPAGFFRVRPQTRSFTLLWTPEHYRTMPRNSCTFILHPAETILYQEIGKRFIQEYKAEYGEVNHYLVDAFNELMPPVTPEHRYDELQAFGRTLYEGIIAGDANGTWVMQGWLFTHLPNVWDKLSVAAFLKDIPNDRMIVLDYANDLLPAFAGTYGVERWKNLDAFFGKQWVNGMAHAFGGNTNVRGNLALMASEPARVLHDENKGNLIGWGMCPEGTQQNEVAYELMTDMGWSADAIDLDTWIPAYCKARYGAAPESMIQAWTLLRRSAYSTHIWGVHQAWQREPTQTPAAKGVDSGAVFEQATKLFLSCAPELGAGQLYRHDLIELVVQTAGGRVDQALALAIQAIDSKQMDAARTYMQSAASWLTGMDALLNTREDRRLESWVTQARRWGKSDAESSFLDSNSRLIITFWGWPELSDYACREWAGLTRDYYLPRWMTWLEARMSGQAFSTEVWEQTWLSRPYAPSQAKPVNDVAENCRDLLRRTDAWTA